MKKILYVCLMVLLCVSLTASICFAKGEKKSYTIGFVPGIIVNPFYISMHYGAKAAADQLGLKLIWQGPQDWDFAKQTVIVDALISRGVDALVLSPCDPEALKETVLAVSEVSKRLADKELIKVIAIPEKMVSIVVR